MDKISNHDAIRRWAEEAKSVSHISAVVCDLNGVLRGKKAPIKDIEKIIRGSFKLPLSTLLLDIWGRDVMQSGQVLETGDVDGVLAPTSRGIIPVSWGVSPTALFPLSMNRFNGEPYEGDARQVLASIVQQYKSRDMTPVCAMELEFYLYKPADAGKGLSAPGGGRAVAAASLYDLNELEHVSPIIEETYAVCARLGIPVGATISEGGAGQFEINLVHQSDALRAADDALLLKQIVKGVAKKHGLAATFMATPFGDDAGNGLHLHVSILNGAGENVFDNGKPEGSKQLRHAIGGLLEALPTSMLVFAPHANSYRRLREGTHAPTKCNWGYDNRTAAIRVPSGSNTSRRIEHRVAGADANPYLVMAVILGAMLNGLEEKTPLGAPAHGNAYESGSANLPNSWQDAISAFATSSMMRKIFNDLLVDAFTACKRQELETLAAIVPPAEIEAYLETV
ncbi:MAG: glutamine synthetase family protein [Pseudomonadota bacterium]